MHIFFLIACKTSVGLARSRVEKKCLDFGFEAISLSIASSCRIPTPTVKISTPEKKT